MPTTVTCARAGSDTGGAGAGGGGGRWSGWGRGGRYRGSRPGCTRWSRSGTRRRCWRGPRPRGSRWGPCGSTGTRRDRTRGSSWGTGRLGRGLIGRGWRRSSGLWNWAIPKGVDWVCRSVHRVSSVVPMTNSLVPPAGQQRVLALAQLSNSVGDGAYYVTSALYFTHVVGLDPARVGLGLTVGWAVGSVVGVPLGRLADRRGARGTAVLLALA